MATKMKKEIMIIMLLVFASVGLAFVGNLYTFVGQDMPFNVTWDDKITTNITRFIDLPFAYIFNFTLGLTSYNYTNNSFTHPASGTIEIPSGSNWINSGNIDDEILSPNANSISYCSVQVSGTECIARLKYDVVEGSDKGYIVMHLSNGSRAGSSSQIGVNFTYNYTLPTNCNNGSSIKLNINHEEGSGSGAFDLYPACLKVGGGTTSLETVHAAFIREIDMEWETYHFVNNSVIYVANEEQLSYDGPFDNSTNLSIDTDLLHRVLRSNCSCTNCSINGINCRVPVTFYSEDLGIWGVNITNLTYGYGFDNESDSFFIDSNATTLNVTFDKGGANTNFDVSFFYGPTTSYGQNFSFSGTDTEFTMTIYPNWANLYLGGIIAYESNQTYNIFQLPIDNETTVIDIEVEIGGTDIVEFTVLDYNGNPVEDAYIQIQKYDVENNEYTTTEIILTGSDGIAYGNLILIDVFYRFIVLYEGEVRLIEPETGGTKVYTTTKTFTISLDEQEWYEDYELVGDITTNFDFNESGTNYYTFDWVNPTGASVRGCLDVQVRNTSGSYIVSSSCTTSSGATLLYQVSPLTCGSYVASAYFDFSGAFFTVEDSPITVDYPCEFVFKDVKEGNLDPVFFGLFLILALVLIGIPFPELSFILLILGLIVSTLVGLWEVSWVSIVGIIIVGGFYLYKGSRK